LQPGRVCLQGAERRGAGDYDRTSFGGLILTTRNARIVSQLNERFPESPFWRHVCVLRLRVQGLFGPPSGGTAGNLLSGRTIAAPPACLPLAHWQNSNCCSRSELQDLTVRGRFEVVPGSCWLAACPNISRPGGPGLINPALNCCQLDARKGPKGTRVDQRQRVTRRQGLCSLVIEDRGLAAVHASQGLNDVY